MKCDYCDGDDKFDEMYNHQIKLQKDLGNLDKIKSSESLKQQYINQMILAIHEEATEIMRESAYKNPDYVPFGWKKNQHINLEKFKEEIIDLQHFIFNLAIVAEMLPEEFKNRYLNKNKENHKRQKDGY